MSDEAADLLRRMPHAYEFPEKLLARMSGIGERSFAFARVRHPAQASQPGAVPLQSVVGARDFSKALLYP